MVVPGVNSLPMPSAPSSAASSAGMIPPPVTRMSASPFSSSNRFTRGNRVMWAPERMESATTSTSSWSAVLAIISGVW